MLLESIIIKWHATIGRDLFLGRDLFWGHDSLLFSVHCFAQCAMFAC